MHGIRARILHSASDIYMYIYIRRYVYLVLSQHPSQTNQARRHAILDTRLGV